MNGSLTRWLPPPDPSGPVTCAACGCRLTEAYVGDRRAWQHFSSLHPDQDARGCRPACVRELHGRDGHALAAEILDVTSKRPVIGFRIEDLAEEGAAA